jgi:hypothetical protein
VICAENILPDKFCRRSMLMNGRGRGIRHLVILRKKPTRAKSVEIPAFGRSKT